VTSPHASHDLITSHAKSPDLTICTVTLCHTYTGALNPRNNPVPVSPMTPKMYDQKEMMMMPLFVLAETKNSL
jgi:hypothetical protein